MEGYLYYEWNSFTTGASVHSLLSSERSHELMLAYVLGLIAFWDFPDLRSGRVPIRGMSLWKLMNSVDPIRVWFPRRRYIE